MPYNNYKREVPTPYNNQALTGSKAVTAGVYAQEQVNMPNMPEGALPGLLRLEIEQEVGKYTDAAGDYVRAHLSTKSQDDIIGIEDPDCICVIKKEAKGIGLEPDNLILSYDFPAPTLISMKQLWLGLKCTLAQTIKYRLSWVPRPSAVPQRDNLVSQLQF